MALWATQHLPKTEINSNVNLIKPKWLLDAKDRTKQEIWTLFAAGEQYVDMGKHNEAIERFKEAYRIAAKVTSYPNPKRALRTADPGSAGQTTCLCVCCVQ